MVHAPHFLQKSNHKHWKPTLTKCTKLLFIFGGKKKVQRIESQNSKLPRLISECGN